MEDEILEDQDTPPHNEDEVQHHGPQSALATAHIISDIHSVPDPGVSSPNPSLNQNAEEGKLRFVTIGLHCCTSSSALP